MPNHGRELGHNYCSAASGTHTAPKAMALSLVVAPVSFYAPAPVAAMRASAPRMEDMSTWTKEAGAFVVGAQTTEKPFDTSEISDAAGLKELAEKLNPIVGYWDPLNIGDCDAELIGWFRQAEIKHGRVAMAAFVGFTAQANGLVFPGNLQGLFAPKLAYADIAAAGSPLEQWDALPSSAKLQIFGVIGLLEVWGELTPALEAAGTKHYVRGGKPGVYPSFAPIREALGQPPLDLFDPFGFSKNKTPEQKERGLLAELNNGRLAMLGARAPRQAAPVVSTAAPAAPSRRCDAGDATPRWMCHDARTACCMCMHAAARHAAHRAPRRVRAALLRVMHPP